MEADALDTIPATFTVRRLFDMTDAPQGILCNRCHKTLSSGWTREDGIVCFSCVAIEEEKVSE